MSWARKKKLKRTLLATQNAQEIFQNTKLVISNITNVAAIAVSTKQNLYKKKKTTVRLDLKRKILKAEQVKYQSHELTSQHQNLHLKLPIATNFFG